MGLAHNPLSARRAAPNPAAGPQPLPALAPQLCRRLPRCPEPLLAAEHGTNPARKGLQDAPEKRAQAWSPPTPQFSMRWVLPRPEHSSADPLPAPPGAALPPPCASAGTFSLPRNGAADSSTDSTLVFPLESKQLQTGDFREPRSLASTYAVLREPLIIPQIFLELLVNELWLHLCSNSSAGRALVPVPAAPCHPGDGPRHQRPPASRAPLKPTLCSAV